MVDAEGRRGRRRGGRRGRRSLNRVARERQAAWARTRQPLLTLALTRELEELYDEHRERQARPPADDYRGRTWRPR